MTFRTLMVALLLTLGLAASNAEAELIPVEESYELNAELVILPSTTSGALLLRSCAQCQVVSLQVDNETQFILGREPVTLSQFRRHGVMKGLLMVFYEHDSQRVTRVRLPTGAVQPGQDLDVESDD